MGRALRCSDSSAPKARGSPPRQPNCHRRLDRDEHTDFEIDQRCGIVLSQEVCLADKVACTDGKTQVNDSNTSRVRRRGAVNRHMDIQWSVLIAIIYSLILLLYHLAVNHGCRFVGASNLFVIVQAFLFLGTLSAKVDVSEHMFHRWVILQLVGIVGFTLGALVSNAIMHTNPRLAFRSFSERDWLFDVHSATYWALMLLGVLSAVVGIGFSIRFGQNALIRSLLLRAQDPVDSARAYSALRKSAVYGDTYLGYGYVMQFTDYLLPCFSHLLMFRANYRRCSLDGAVWFVFTCITVWCLTVTGRREPMIQYALCLWLVVSTRYGAGLGKLLQRRWRSLIALIMPGVGLVFLLTNAVRYSTGISLIAGVAQLWNRMGVTLASEKLRMMEFIFEQPIVWGQQWMDSLLTIAPRGHMPGLSNQMHAMLYGSSMGNSPLEIWGSAWHNFGWIGTVIVPFIMGLFLQWITLCTLTGPKTPTRLVLLTMMGIGLARVSEPYLLLNNGVFTLWLVLIGTRMTRRYDNMVLGVRSRGGSRRAATPWLY